MTLKCLLFALTLSSILFGTIFINPAWAMDEQLEKTPIPLKTQKITMGEIEISSGRIAYLQTQGKGRSIVCLHHNSGSKEVFLKQLEDLGEEYHIIALDLPGHGESSDAYHPEETYSFPGYAKTTIEFTEKLGLSEQKIMFCGLSMGGHIAIEILHQRPNLVAGLLITGAPPISLSEEGMAKAFKPCKEVEMISQETQFTEEQAKRFSTAGIDPIEVPLLVKAGMRTDGRARAYMVQAIKKGKGANQKEVIEQSSKPIGIVCGAKDEGICNEYIEKGINYNKNLFKILTLDCGHGCPWIKDKEFNGFAKEFMEFIELSSRF